VSTKKSTELLERAYVALLRTHDWGRHSIEGQRLLCDLRDTIAATLGQDSDTVQDRAESTAIAAGKPKMQIRSSRIRYLEARVIGQKEVVVDLNKVIYCQRYGSQSTKLVFQGGDDLTLAIPYEQVRAALEAMS